MTDASRPSGRSALWLTLAGAGLSWFAFLTYFLVVPRWPDLRDSGVPNVVLGSLGLALSLSGARVAFQAKRWRVTGSGLTLLAGLPFVVLTGYIFVLSYRLPSTEGVVAAGSKAPPLALPDQDGRERTLDEFAGRPVVLVFFRGHW